jgi:hypothetical protein
VEFVGWAEGAEAAVRGRRLILGMMCAGIGATASSAPAAIDADATRPLGGAARSGTVVVGLGMEPRTLNVLTIEGNSPASTTIAAR